MALVVSSTIGGSTATANATALSPSGQRKHRTGDPKDHRKHPLNDAAQGTGDMSSDGHGHTKDMRAKTKKVMTMKPAGFKYPPLLNESPIDWLYGDNMAEFSNSKTYTK